MSLNLPTVCDGCSKKFLVPHSLSCPKGGLVLAWNNDAAKLWGALSAWDINPIAISYEPKINSRTVQGERNRAGARVVTREQEGSDQEVKNVATGQARVPDDSRTDVYAHGFWKWGPTALFDMQIVNSCAGSYLLQTSAKSLATEEKEKNDKYLQPCLESMHSFNPMVYSADVIPGTEAVAAQQHLALLFSNKLKREYSEMCGFVGDQMSLAIVISNTLLLCGARYKEE